MRFFLTHFKCNTVFLPTFYWLLPTCIEHCSKYSFLPDIKLSCSLIIVPQSGSSDSLTVERGYSTGDPGSTLAFNMFAYSAKKCLGLLFRLFKRFLVTVTQATFTLTAVSLATVTPISVTLTTVALATVTLATFTLAIVHVELLP